ncbi:DNA-directed RNA polymerase subunit N [Candidatus Micrarchaeota archaeon CG10_big_fil_rev_8_21_14_0_10_45_29]|nr:MAG: DNA-directed RNA polymerase subunit N [Candidatus Micrarchaeota archaeon CG10_big_fil_rev_8_21_14_0_10_45_29]
MYFPIRCFTCGAPIAQHWEEYNSRTKSGDEPAKVLDDLGVKRVCCRRMFISHVEVMDKVAKYDRL